MRPSVYPKEKACFAVLLVVVGLGQEQCNHTTTNFLKFPWSQALRRVAWWDLEATRQKLDERGPFGAT